MADRFRRRGRDAEGQAPRGRHGGPGGNASRSDRAGTDRKGTERGWADRADRAGTSDRADRADGADRRGRSGPAAWGDAADNPRGRVQPWDAYRPPRQYDGRSQDAHPAGPAVPDRPAFVPAPGEGPDTIPDTTPDLAPGFGYFVDFGAGSDPDFKPWFRTAEAARPPAGRNGTPRAPVQPLPPSERGGRPPRARVRVPVLLGRALLSAVSATVLLASGLVWGAYRDLTSGMLTSSAVDSVKPGEKGYVPPHLDGSVNLLLIGLDSRKDMNGNDLPTQFVEDELHAGSSEIGGYNTNVLIFMHIPADGGRVSAFSIARDDYVEEPGGDSSVGPIPDLGTHKIKEAYGRAKAIAVQRLQAQGMTDKARIEAVSREVGRESTIRAVQLLTGEHVDHLAEINLLGFYDIAKAVGPIRVCLNHAVDDPIEHGAGTGLKLPAGYSELDAAQALQFVRQRYHLPRGDLDRNRRQQAFLSAVAAKLRGEGVLGDLGKMQALMDVVKKDVVIDDGWDVLDFAQRAQNLTGGDAVFDELPITGQPTLPGDGSVNTVDPRQIRRIVMTAFGDAAQLDAQPSDSASSGDPYSSGSAPDAQTSDNQTSGTQTSDTATPDEAASGGTPPPAAHDAVVDVYNAAGRAGLAAGVAGRLGAAGWPVSEVGDAPAQARSTVFYGPGAEDQARQLAAEVGLTATPQPSTRASAQRVMIYLGADYTPPGASARASAGAVSGVTPPDSGVSSSNASAGSPSSGDPAAPASGGIAMSDGVTCVN